ncbi:MAG: hypothetical protein SFY80_06165 [Verrucomicrobiota bacterium]|nr:hypothetical protein [Verrucomicrobiota bacterium]
MNVNIIVAKLKQFPIAVIAALLTIIFSVVIYLRLDTPTELEKIFSTRDNVLKTMENNAKQAIDLTEHLKKLESQSTIVNTFLMDKKAKAANYSSFYELEKASGVSIVKIDPEDNTPKSDGIERPTLTLFEPIIWQIDVVGSYQQILSFFYQLQTVKYFIRVNQFDIGPSTDTTKAGSIKASIRLEVLGITTRS